MSVLGWIVDALQLGVNKVAGGSREEGGVVAGGGEEVVDAHSELEVVL